MTTEDYKRRMAELGVDRGALDAGMEEAASFAMIRKTKVSPLLKGWRTNGKKMARQATHRGPNKV